MNPAAFKVIIIGNSDVGKTSLLSRYIDGTYHQNALPTIGVDFKQKKYGEQEGAEAFVIRFWDTSGQERFQTLTKAFYRSSHGVLVVYDVTDGKSFSDVRRWVQNADDENIPQKMLIGNKCDLPDRQVSWEHGARLAEDLGMRFIETSARTNLNVDLAFDALAQVFQEQSLNAQNSTPQKADLLDLNQAEKKRESRFRQKFCGK